MSTSNTNKNGNWYEKIVGQTILRTKYLHEGEESVDDLARRVASAFKDRKFGNDVGKAIKDADFIPAGRSLYGAGSKGKFKASMSNCYILPTPSDNIESIFDTAKMQARIYSYGGGTGVNISNLRPNEAKVNNSALTSSGSVSFMELYNTVGKVIGASNKKKGNTSARRAALLMALNCNHPDIEEFLEIKQNNESIQSANISIVFDDKFMKAVETKSDYELYFKVEATGEVIKKTINAYDFFKKFATSAWDFAEPGAIFINNVREHNLLSGYPEELYKIDVSNPCFTGDMRLLTSDGYKTFRELCNKEVRVLNRNNNWALGKVWKSGHKHIINVVVEANRGVHVIRCTPNHVFLLANGIECEASNLLGKSLTPQYFGEDRDENHFYARVINVVDQGEEADVYDFTEPETHWGVVEGVYVHNCSEFFGNAGNACNLGSINLYNCVKRPFTAKAEIDWLKLSDLVYTGVKALDEILDYGYDMQPLELNRKCIDDWRSIGLGTFGWADMFVALGIRYGSKDAIDLAKDISRNVLYNALAASCAIAKEKGAFEKYDWEYIKKSPMIAELEKENEDLYELIKLYGLRNGSLISVAPTGSIATMCGLSGGLEPYFEIKYERTTHSLSNEGKTFTVVTRATEDLLIHNGMSIDNIDIEEIKKKFPFIVSSHDIDPFDRVDMQGAMQKYVDNAISSTVNLKNEATVEDTMNVFLNAWKTGCKGITVFRDGCKRTSILKSTNDQKATIDTVFDSIIPIKRKNLPTDVKLDAQEHYKHTACVRNMHGFTTKLNGELFEVFTFPSGGCLSNIATITRLSSLLFRSGTVIPEIIDALRDTPCPACTELIKQGRTDISKSCGNAIADMLMEAYEKEETSDIKTSNWLVCPSCGKKGMNPAEHCPTCKECGFSRCD